MADAVACQAIDPTAERDTCEKAPGLELLTVLRAQLDPLMMNTSPNPNSFLRAKGLGSGSQRCETGSDHIFNNVAIKVATFIPLVRNRPTTYY